MNAIFVGNDLGRVNGALDGYEVVSARATFQVIKVVSETPNLSLLVFDGTSKTGITAAVLRAVRDAAPSVPIIVLCMPDDAEMHAFVDRHGATFVADAPLDAQRIRAVVSKTSASKLDVAS